MSYLDTLHQELDQYHLLKHPFYQAWNNGELSINTLQIYAKEYYGHVAAFPRYISSIHSLCEKIEDRQILLENLIDEEQGIDNHPELWMKFAEGLGCSREDCRTQELNSTKKLVNEYFDITRSSYASGLGALYAYERQTPEIAKSKIDGLQKFYNIKDEQTLKFFLVHMEADEWHTEECSNLLNKMNPEEQQKALNGAVKGAQLLWNFLDEMQEIHLKN
jgi:pyrroloquinoline-quinone synthase